MLAPQSTTFDNVYVKLIREFMGWARQKLAIPMSHLKLGLFMQPSLAAGFFGFLIARGSAAQTIKVKCSQFKRIVSYLASTAGQLAQENADALTEWAERLSRQADRAIPDSGAKAERVRLAPQMDEFVLFVQQRLSSLMERVEEDLARWGAARGPWGRAPACRWCCMCGLLMAGAGWCVAVGIWAFFGF